MAERPVIVLPTATRATKSKLHGGPAGIKFPSAQRQVERIEPRLQELENYFNNRIAEVRASAQGQLPEEVLVIEIAGSVDDFYKAASKVSGLRLLAEWDQVGMQPDEDFRSDADDKLLSGRLFLVMTNQRAIEQLRSLWSKFKSGVKFPKGYAPFRHVFAQLRDLRRWSANDRLFETGVISYWQAASVLEDATQIPFEIELWYRNQPHEREQAAKRIKAELGRIGGEVINVFELPAIRYHAITASLPNGQILQLVQQADSELLGDTAIMFFRPSGQLVVDGHSLGELTESVTTPANPVESLPPVVGLFDGVPLQNHTLLDGRLWIDDPDDYGQHYLAQDRNHGTTMSSIIIHGDLSAPLHAMKRPLYVRPVMRCDPQPWDPGRQERVPFGVNPVDLFYRAVRRLFEGEGATPAVAPDIKVICVSIGDSDQPFIRAISPWARLLDWLSYKYNVLFCVSAGNQSGPIELDIPRAALSSSSALEKERSVIRSIANDIRNRRLLSPSEGINVLTVGSSHEDSSTSVAFTNRFDLYSSAALPSPVNRLGSGFKNSIKPEVLFPGGRQYYREKPGTSHTNAIVELSTNFSAPGVKSAATSSVAGQLDRTKFSCGTSNANALATASAARFIEQLELIHRDPHGSRITPDFFAVLLKAMLVHTASQGEALNVLRTYLKTSGMTEDKFKRLASRFLGYGFGIGREEIFSEDHKAVMVGCGKLTHGKADIYEIPIPPSLSGVRGKRRVTVTLAWNSPIVTTRRAYREASLWFELNDEILGTNRIETEYRSSKNGTVQHEIVEGEIAVALPDDAYLTLKINCRGDAIESFDDYIRYGLLVSIEAAENLRLPIYEEVVNKIRPIVGVRANIA